MKEDLNKSGPNWALPSGLQTYHEKLLTLHFLKGEFAQNWRLPKTVLYVGRWVGPPLAQKSGMPAILKGQFPKIQ